MYLKIPKTVIYYSCTITNLTKFDFPLPSDQTSRSQKPQMIGENSSVGLSKLLWTMSDICKASDGTRALLHCSRYKCLSNILIPCFGEGCVCFFVCKKYTTFSTERIVALQSVDNIFPESYDFATKENGDDYHELIFISFSAIHMLCDLKKKNQSAV
jgi:hypothetical protein